MTSENKPADEVAAIDAAFEKGIPAKAKPEKPADKPAPLILPQGVEDPGSFPEGDDEALGVGKGKVTPSEGSPLRDYLREIQQEFQDQEEEGKLGT